MDTHSTTSDALSSLAPTRPSSRVCIPNAGSTSHIAVGDRAVDVTPRPLKELGAARAGADVVVLERYNHLGGLSTGGLVIWIDRMTDWEGRQVIRGFAEEFLDRFPREGGFVAD